jgi:hypothetical protein
MIVRIGIHQGQLYLCCLTPIVQLCDQRWIIRVERGMVHISQSGGVSDLKAVEGINTQGG